MIAIDDREAQEALSHHQVDIREALEVPSIVQRLDSADYCFLDRDRNPLGIERCEIGNLVQKLRSGELEEQLSRCQEAYTSIVLLVEGVFDQMEGLLAVHKAGSRGYFRVHVYPHTYYEATRALEVRLSELGIEILHSPNFLCSMTLIRAIYKQRVRPEEQHQLFKHTRVVRLPARFTTNPAVPMLMSLCPRLSEKIAALLLARYGSIWGILHAPDKELLEVEGLGKGLLTRLRRNVGYEKDCPQ